MLGVRGRDGGFRPWRCVVSRRCFGPRRASARRLLERWRRETRLRRRHCRQLGAGGASGCTVHASAEVHDPAAGTWTSTSTGSMATCGPPDFHRTGILLASPCRYVSGSPGAGRRRLPPGATTSPSGGGGSSRPRARARGRRGTRRDPRSGAPSGVRSRPPPARRAGGRAGHRPGSRRTLLRSPRRWRRGAPAAARRPRPPGRRREPRRRPWRSRPRRPLPSRRSCTPRRRVSSSRAVPSLPATAWPRATGLPASSTSSAVSRGLRAKLEGAQADRATAGVPASARAARTRRCARLRIAR